MEAPKDEYRIRTNKDVYAEYCCEQPNASYNDEYVKDLESQLSKKQEEIDRLDLYLEEINNTMWESYMIKKIGITDGKRIMNVLKKWAK